MINLIGKALLKMWRERRVKLRFKRVLTVEEKMFTDHEKIWRSRPNWYDNDSNNSSF
jgi:hypothetical protein